MAIKEELLISSKAALGPLNQMIKSLKAAGVTIDDLGKESKKAAQNSGLLTKGIAKLRAGAKNLLAVVKTAGPAALLAFGKMALSAFEDSRMALADVRASFGATAEDWISWSRDMQDATTFSNEAFLSAATNMRTLVANYGLAEGQVRNLITATADLAALKGLDLLEATNRVQSALRGEAEASEYLGLTLNDTYMKNIAFNGSLKSTWETLDDAEKAQYRYTETLNQMAYAEGEAAAQTETLSGVLNQLKAVAQDWLADVGERWAPTLIKAAKAIKLMATWTKNLDAVMREHEEEVRDTVDTYDEYLKEMLRVNELSKERYDTLIADHEASMMAGDATEYLAEQYGFLTEGAWELRDVYIPLSTETDTVADKMMMMGREIRGAVDASDAASESLHELSTSASKVADSFGEMEFDDAALWEMARASGASVDALSDLAKDLGIASDAEIQAALAGWELVEQFGAGEISAEEYAAAMNQVGVDELAMGVAAADARGEMDPLMNSILEARNAALELAAGAGEAMNELGGLEQAALLAQAALAQIERNIEVEIHYRETGERRHTGGGVQEHATGTLSAPGGWSLLGERGPELVDLPPGSRVYPAGQTRQMLNQTSRQGDPAPQVTVNVYGPFGPGYTPTEAGQGALDGFVDAARARGIRI